MTMQIRGHYFFSGAVQGVGFRRTTQIFAQGLGLHGWVRNLPDGRVELMAEGGADAIERLLDDLKAHFRITQIEEAKADHQGEFRDFKVLR